MIQPKHTVFYPGLIRWTRALNEWSQIEADTNKGEATRQIWGPKEAWTDWMKEGGRLMLSTQMLQEEASMFQQYIRMGNIDPIFVTQQLQKNAWGYVDYIEVDNEHFEEEVYMVLSEQWQQMMGAVMVMTCEIPDRYSHASNEAELRTWLRYGLDLVLPDTDEDIPDSLLWSPEHTNWLNSMSAKYSWVHEEMVLGVLANPEWLPQWREVINDKLLEKPSLAFIRSFLHCLADTGTEENVHRFLQQNAPRLYTISVDVLHLYEHLYGAKPELSATVLAYNEYVDGRAQMLYDTLSHAGNADWLVDSSNNPAIDKLF